MPRVCYSVDMKRDISQEVLRLVRKGGVLRPRDLDAHGIARVYPSRLCRVGLLERVGRGLYRIPGAPYTGRESYANACKRIPRGVICLLSALYYHELTTQVPSEVWMAIPRKAWLPRLQSPPLHIVRFSEATLRAGLETHSVGGAEVRVFNVPKTVADCFKYRNKIGLDVALEALRDCWRRRLCTMDELWEYAGTCRVQNVMRPYLEALVS